MEHPQMNPTPTPNSPAPVNIARLRELLLAYQRVKNRLGFDLMYYREVLDEALRNAAPELLDELDRLRDTAARLRYYHEQKETENRQLYEEVSELETKLRRECETHSATSAERDKLREEVERLKLGKENLRDALGQMTSERDHASKVRDSLRQQNEQLLKEIEELKKKE